MRIHVNKSHTCIPSAEICWPCVCASLALTETHANDKPRSESSPVERVQFVQSLVSRRGDACLTKEKDAEGKSVGCCCCFVVTTLMHESTFEEQQLDFKMPQLCGHAPFHSRMWIRGECFLQRRSEHFVVRLPSSTHTI